MLFLSKRNLLKRGYPRSLINETMRKVKFLMREEKMKPKEGDPPLSPDNAPEPEGCSERFGGTGPPYTLTSVNI